MIQGYKNYAFRFWLLECYLKVANYYILTLFSNKYENGYMTYITSHLLNLSN